MVDRPNILPAVARAELRHVAGELRVVGAALEALAIGGKPGPDLALERLQCQQWAGNLLLTSARLPGGMSEAIAGGLLALPHEAREEDLAWVGTGEAEALRGAGCSVRGALVFLLVRRLMGAGSAELMPAVRVRGLTAAAQARAAIRMDAAACRLSATELEMRAEGGVGVGTMLVGTLEGLGEALGVDARTARRRLSPVKLSRQRWAVDPAALEAARHPAKRHSDTTPTPLAQNSGKMALEAGGRAANVRNMVVNTHCDA